MFSSAESTAPTCQVTGSPLFPSEGNSQLSELLSFLCSSCSHFLSCWLLGIYSVPALCAQVCWLIHPSKSSTPTIFQALFYDSWAISVNKIDKSSFSPGIFYWKEANNKIDLLRMLFPIPLLWVVVGPRASGSQALNFLSLASIPLLVFLIAELLGVPKLYSFSDGMEGLKSRCYALPQNNFFFFFFSIHHVRFLDFLLKWWWFFFFLIQGL